MKNFTKQNWVKTVAMVLVCAFVSFDITWATGGGDFRGMSLRASSARTNPQKLTQESEDFTPMPKTNPVKLILRSLRDNEIFSVEGLKARESLAHISKEEIKRALDYLVSRRKGLRKNFFSYSYHKPKGYFNRLMNGPLINTWLILLSGFYLSMFIANGRGGLPSMFIQPYKIITIFVVVYGIWAVIKAFKDTKTGSYEDVEKLVLKNLRQGEEFTVDSLLDPDEKNLGLDKRVVAEAVKWMVYDNRLVGGEEGTFKRPAGKKDKLSVAAVAISSLTSLLYVGCTLYYILFRGELPSVGIVMGGFAFLFLTYKLNSIFRKGEEIHRKEMVRFNKVHRKIWQEKGWIPVIDKPDVNYTAVAASI